MADKGTLAYIGSNIRQVFSDIQDDINFTADNFKAAKGKEKAWVLLKTFCVAMACGIIALALSALGGMPGLGPFVAGFVVGGTIAFYRFARSAEVLPVQQAVNGVKRALNKAAAKIS